MVNLIKLYIERYHISNLDLADSAETNRLHLLIVCPFLFLFGFGDLIVIFAFHFHQLQDYISSIVYFGIFTLTSGVMFIYSRLIKDVAREKSYILKTIPFYFLLYVGMSAAVYNFYVLHQPYNGVLTYFITNIIAISAFTFSPIFFFIAITITLGLLIPGVYENFGVSGLMDTILAAILIHGFSLYRRFSEKKLLLLLKKQKTIFEAKTFGNFTLIYDNKVVKFSRTKSNELMGYLIYKKGSSVNSKELISLLWGDNADSSRYGNNLRNHIIDIKRTLADLNINDFFIAEYNNFRINPELVKCDYYDFLAGDKNALKSFAGEFMSQFSWAEQENDFLEKKALQA